MSDAKPVSWLIFRSFSLDNFTMFKANTYNEALHLLCLNAFNERVTRYTTLSKLRQISNWSIKHHHFIL